MAAGKDKGSSHHPAHKRRAMPADVRALGSAGIFIQNAIKTSDAARRNVKKRGGK